MAENRGREKRRDGRRRWKEWVREDISDNGKTNVKKEEEEEVGGRGEGRKGKVGEKRN